jgi:hypothetical protein
MVVKFGHDVLLPWYIYTEWRPKCFSYLKGFNMDRVVYVHGENVARTSEPVTLSLAAMGFLVGGGAAAGALAVNENKKNWDEWWAQDHIKNVQDAWERAGKFTRDPAGHIQDWWREKLKSRSTLTGGEAGGHASHNGSAINTTDPLGVAKYVGLHPH